MGRAENEIQKDILAWLKAHGVLAWRNNNRPRKGTIFLGKKGLGDIIGVLPCSAFLSIEVKTKDGRLSAEQKEFIDIVTACGGKAFLARSVPEVAFELKKCITCSNKKTSNNGVEC